MAISFTKLHFNEPLPVARRLLWHVLSVGTVSRDEPERHEGSDKPGAFLFWIVSGCGVEQLGGDSEFLLTKTDDATLIRRAETLLVDLVTRRPGGYEWQVHRLINEVLGTLLHTKRMLPEPVRELSGPVTKVVQAVLATPARDWKARDLAAIAGMGHTKLRELFKQCQRETLHEFFQRARLDQGRLLLCDPRLTVKDVAGQLSFSSEFYFSHFFREATGMSPTQFRLKSKS